jgi:hypothetical protein
MTGPEPHWWECARCQLGIGTATGRVTDQGTELACGRCGNVWYVHSVGRTKRR